MAGLRSCAPAGRRSLPVRRRLRFGRWLCRFGQSTDSSGSRGGRVTDEVDAVRRANRSGSENIIGMSELIVVTGPPGAGKSTVAQILAQRFELSALIAGDAFFAMIDRGYIDPWTEAARDQNEVVIAAAGAAAGRMAQGGYTVVFDGVIGPWFLKTFLTATGLREVHYVILLPHEHVCLERVKSRTGHGFTDQAATRHMYREFARAATSPLRAVRSTSAPETLATTITQLLKGGSLRVPSDQG